MPEEKIPVTGSFISREDFTDLIRIEYNEVAKGFNERLGRLATTDEKNARRMAQLYGLALLLNQCFEDIEITDPVIFTDALIKLMSDGPKSLNEVLDMLRVKEPTNG